MKSYFSAHINCIILLNLQKFLPLRYKYVGQCEFHTIIKLKSKLNFRKVMKKLPSKILVSMCVSLACLLLVFLLGVEKKPNTSTLTCQFSAALLHYFILSTFLWTLVQAYNLYMNFVKIFKHGNSMKKFMLLASLFAWGKYNCHNKAL